MRTVFATVFAVTIAAGCTESTEPTTPILEVNVATSGPAADIDPDGYTLTLGTGMSFTVPANGLIKITDAPAGVHEVKIDGVAANCTPTAPVDRTVRLWENVETPTRLRIAVTCQSNSGAVRVSTQTHGDDADADGYAAHIRRFDGGAPAEIAVTSNGEGTRVLGAGAVEVALDGVAGNCKVDGANPRMLEIEHAKFQDLSFSVSCVANGILSVSLRTPGERVDPVRT